MPIPTPEERVGQRLGDKYLLRAILGRGGMGVVYEAEHTWTGRSVAVKLLLPELARDEAVARRFLQEARAAARFSHPSIVDVLDMGTTDESTVYMVLELLQGEPLSRRLKRLGQLSVDECLELLLPILDALAEAHAAGVTHRDLKPDNIFVSLGPHGAVLPKLLDFGVARLTDEWGGSDMATRTGQPIGTPW
jgi:serine/threonine-protein kinase